MNIKLQAFFELRGMPSLSDAERVAWICEYVEHVERERAVIRDDLIAAHHTIMAELEARI